MAFHFPLPEKEIVIPAYIIKVTNANGEQREVGSIQSINPSETREVTESYEIGTKLTGVDNVGEPFENIPGFVRDRKIEVTKIALWDEEIIQGLGNGTLGGLATQTKPFEIIEFRYTPGSTEPSAVRKYVDCYVQSWGTTREIGRGDIREIQRASISFRKIEVL